MSNLSFQKAVKQLLNASLSILVVSPLTIVSLADAATLNLPNVPVDAATTTMAAKPNFMYILDNSGSMVRDYISPSLSDDSPALRDWGGQCKTALKNRDGRKILDVKQVGSRLKIKTENISGTPADSIFTVGDLVYIAIPEFKVSGKPFFSGTYEIKASDYVAGTSSTCTAWNTNTITQPPYSFGQTEGFDSAGSCYPAATSPISNSGSTTQGFTSKAGNSGTDPNGNCGWYDPPDIPPGGQCVSSTAGTSASGGTNLEIDVTPDTGLAGQTNQQMTTAQLEDAYIQMDRDYNNTNPSWGVDGWYETSSCDTDYYDNSVYGYEPPNASAQVNSLYYNPAVTYEPPPQPTKVGQTYPANLMPSMTRSYTNGWTTVPNNGLQLMTTVIKTGAYYTYMPDRNSTNVGDPLTPAAIYWMAGGTTNNLNYKPEMVWCDTPSRPQIFSSDQAWHESNRCKQNLANSNTSLKSPNYPYFYPPMTDGIAGGNPSSPSQTIIYYDTEQHQYGDPSLSGYQSVMAADPIGFYVFGERYYQANPHYFTVTPIEYCTTAQLTDCKLASTFTPTPTVQNPPATHKFPSFVRYCRSLIKAGNAARQTLADDPDHTGTEPECQAQYTGATTNDWGMTGGPDYRFARYGLFNRVEITKNGLGQIDATKSYTKVASRTDCSGSIGASGCTADEEMTNYANWWAYYRTRNLMMKSASARAFDALNSNMRVGLMTINDPQEYNGVDTNGNGSTGTYLKVDDFTNTSGGQKEKWLTALYGVPETTAATPLRKALSIAGKLFSGKGAGVGLADDPVQYSCQKNISLLTTDGYWTGSLSDGTAQKLDATAVGNQDGGATIPPQKDGLNSSDTLADVAMYYNKGGLRNSVLSNCTNQSTPPLTADNLCVPGTDGEKMRTFTMGLGVDGTLGFDKDYRVAGSSPDYDAINSNPQTKNWPTPTANGPTAVDDLWHAAVNGDGAYFSAKSPTDVTSSLASLFSSLSIEAEVGTPPAVTNQRPSNSSTNPDYGFSSLYIKGEWTGNLVARKLASGLGSFYLDSDNDGSPDAPVWCADTPSANDGNTPSSCDVSHSLPSMTAATRNILIAGGGGDNLQSFTFANLTASQKAYFQSGHIGALSQWTSLTVTQKANADEQALVDFIRGDKTYEDQSTAVPPVVSLYRERKGILGDITESDPVYVANPVFGYFDAGYLSPIAPSTTSFVAQQATQNKKTVYVGANDGMLHAFDATNGAERWAFIPTAMLPNLYKLADKDYEHQHTNYVNGKATVGDYFDGSKWRTLLVSGFGAGARGLFAIDVTDPDAPELLWESTDNKLGYIYGKPVITKRVDGTWVVLTTSGYNNSGGSIGGDGHGRFLALNPTSGAILNSADVSTVTFTGYTPQYPGNMAPLSALAADPEKNNVSKYAYAGDIYGNVWVFEIAANVVRPLAQLQAPSLANSAVKIGQPITTPPVLTKVNDNINALVMIGTGKLLEFSDLASNELQTIYAIKDNYSGTNLGIPRDSTGPGNFIEQQFTTTGQSRTISSAASVNLNTDKGWFVDMDDSGERQVSRGYLLGGILYMPSIVSAGTTCEPTGHGWLNQFDYSTGNVISSGVYSDATIAGLVPLVKTGSNGDDVIETAIAQKDGDITVSPPGEPPSSSPARKRLNWRELVQ